MDLVAKMQTRGGGGPKSRKLCRRHLSMAPNGDALQRWRSHQCHCHGAMQDGSLQMRGSLGRILCPTRNGMAASHGGWRWGNKRLILRTSSGRVQTTRTIMAAQRNWWGGTARGGEEGGRNVSSSQTRTLLNCRRRSGMRKKGKMCSRTTYSGFE